MKIFYLCDRIACEHPSGACGNECIHTSDINHAVNFTLMSDKDDEPTYFENKLKIKAGRWMPETEDGFYRCSVCKTLETWEYPYCPTCGARMLDVKEVF